MLSSETIQYCGDDMNCAFDLQLTGSRDLVDDSNAFIQIFQEAAAASEEGNLTLPK